MQESNLRSTVTGEMFAAAARSAIHAALAVHHYNEQPTACVKWVWPRDDFREQEMVGKDTISFV